MHVAAVLLVAVLVCRCCCCRCSSCSSCFASLSCLARWSCGTGAVGGSGALATVAHGGAEREARRRAQRLSHREEAVQTSNETSRESEHARQSTEQWQMQAQRHTQQTQQQRARCQAGPLLLRITGAGGGTAGRRDECDGLTRGCERRTTGLQRAAIEQSERDRKASWISRTSGDLANPTTSARRSQVINATQSTLLNRSSLHRAKERQRNLFDPTFLIKTQLAFDYD